MADSLLPGYRVPTSLSEVQEVAAAIKEQGTKWLTNFYVDEGRLVRWIQKGQISYYSTPKLLLLLRQRNGFRQLYITASDEDDLRDSIEKYLPDGHGIFVTDLLGETPEMRGALLACKWQPYLSLQRIVKINSAGGVAKPVASEHYARPGEEMQIMDMLEENIDPYGEQIPDLDEIVERIAAKEVLVIRDEATGELKAFFSFIRQGSTVTGRFLVTRRKYRDEGWGLDLSDMFFGLHADVRRILGWVREDKKRNLKLYELQGYQKDRLRDEVLIFKGVVGNNG